jgi:large subunit ribosomal protein L21
MLKESMEYAVLEVRGNQYMVKPGDKIIVNGLIEQDKLTREIKVLLHSGKNLEIGSPDLKNDLKLAVEGTTKSKKISVFTYKSKSRYRKKKGHRQEQTIIAWLDDSIKNEVKPKVAKKTATKTPAKKSAPVNPVKAPAKKKTAKPAPKKK